MRRSNASGGARAAMKRSPGSAGREMTSAKVAPVIIAGLLTCVLAVGVASASTTTGAGPTVPPAAGHQAAVGAATTTAVSPTPASPKPAPTKPNSAPAGTAPAAMAGAKPPSPTKPELSTTMANNRPPAAAGQPKSRPPASASGGREAPRPGSTAASYSAGGGTYQVEVAASKSQVLEVPGAYTDLMIADPKIADVIPLTAHSVYVVGKSPGSTALTIYGPGKRLLAAVNVIVGPDIDGFKMRLHEIMPDEKDVSIRAANLSLVLSGTANSPADLSQITALAETYAPGKVVNMLGVQGTQQVMLSVRFVEMERTALKNLSAQVNYAGTGGNPQFNTSMGSALANAFGNAALTFFTSDGNLTLAVDGLETKGLVKTLAEPTLVTMSGDTASFLAGGEVPIPTPQVTGIGSNLVTITYQQFGISLAFTPTILKDGMINLAIKPEVSNIDPSYSVTENGLVIPGFKVRRANTTVELRDGESFTIAGLMSDDYRNDISAFPWLGDIPILGALFKSTSYQKDQTELVIVVTPHLVTARRGPVALPTDHFTPPSDFELFLFGMMSGKAGSINPEDRALMSHDPTKGGVEGPYGHVLY